MKVEYSYLKRQFAPNRPLSKAILSDITKELQDCLFTNGPAVSRFEEAFAKAVKVKHAIAVSSGTAALIVALKAMGMGPGKKVVTCPNTFVATVGAIVDVGARPVFVDAGDDYLMNLSGPLGEAYNDVDLVLPVDLTGNPVVCGRAVQTYYRSVYVLRDSCQAIGAMIGNETPSQKSVMSAFSLHPLKNINAWGDAGMAVTDNDFLAEKARLYRNHGLADRDTVVSPGVNYRIGTVQSVVGFHVLKELEEITERRNIIAKWYDEGLRGVPGVIVPSRPVGIRQAFHTYVIRVERRTELLAHLEKAGIECKVHYPIPVHLQPGYKFLGYKEGDFPKVEAQAKSIISLPVHQYLEAKEIAYVIDTIKRFYRA